MAFEVLSETLPAQTAGGATVVTELGVVPSTFSDAGATLQKVTITSPSLVTGVATNNITYNVRKSTGGGTPVVLATITLGNGTNLPAETPVTLAPTVTSLLPGDVVDVQMVQNGTGLASPAAVLAEVELND